MSISLQKGQKVSLTKESAGLSKVIIGLGWDEVKRSKGFFAVICAIRQVRYSIWAIT